MQPMKKEKAISAGIRQWICHCVDCVARWAMSLSVMGSVRVRVTFEPKEYNVSGVLAYRGRGPGEITGENMPGFEALTS